MKLASLAALGLFVLAPLAASAAPVLTRVMTHLDNPRGLALGPDGVYVAEAGRGGAGPCNVVRGITFCYGASGAISRYAQGRQERVIDGLPSVADAAGLEANGPNDIGFLGSNRAYVTIGLGNDPARRSDFGAAGARLGTLAQFTGRTGWRYVADVAAVEGVGNPAGGPVDSNPYGLLVEQRSVLVTDAGANTLLRVHGDGRAETIAVFRSRPGSPTDSVPTTVVPAPGGGYYVGELTGVPFADGSARIYRVVEGQPTTIAHDGLKTIIDLAVGTDGSLYVLQHATGPVFFAGPGQVVRIAPNGTRTVVLTGLVRPTSLLAAPDGSLYVTNNAVGNGVGEVWRVQL